MMTDLLMSTQGGGNCGGGRKHGAHGGSSATSPRRKVQKDWISSVLSGGASWMPAMAAVSLAVASMIL
jgi:hypothetical protein